MRLCRPSGRPACRRTRPPATTPTAHERKRRAPIEPLAGRVDRHERGRGRRCSSAPAGRIASWTSSAPSDDEHDRQREAPAEGSAAGSGAAAGDGRRSRPGRRPARRPRDASSESAARLTRDRRVDEERVATHAIRLIAPGRVMLRRSSRRTVLPSRWRGIGPEDEPGRYAGIGPTTTGRLNVAAKFETVGWTTSGGRRAQAVDGIGSPRFAPQDSERTLR